MPAWHSGELVFPLPGMDHRKAQEGCEPQIKSVSTLYRALKPRNNTHHLTQVGAQKEQQKFRFVSSDQQ